MDINIVNNQIYHNIKIGSKSIDFNDFKTENSNIEEWKQFIIYSFLDLYQINNDKYSLKKLCEKLLSGDNIDYITYKEFNNILYNAYVGMNFMLDNITEPQYKALEDFLMKNKNIICKCYATKELEINSKLDSNSKVNVLNKK